MLFGFLIFALGNMIGTGFADEAAALFCAVLLSYGGMNVCNCGRLMYV